MEVPYSMIMKNKFFLFTLLLAIALLSACHRETRTDITESSWKVKSVTTYGLTRHVDWSDEFSMPDAYRLVFLNDTLFQLNTSINRAVGIYQFSPQEFIIYKYGTLTFVCCEEKLDKQLLHALPKVTSYKTKENTLILKGDGCTIKLVKE